MHKRSRGVARRRIARTSGKSASALTKESLHGVTDKSLHAETDKTSDLALDTVGPGEVMSGNQGRQDFRRPELAEGRIVRR
jgi:hypothetical protein